MSTQPVFFILLRGSPNATTIVKKLLIEKRKLAHDAKKRKKEYNIEKHRAIYGMPRRSDLIFSKGGYAAKIAYPPLEMIPLRAMYQISGEEITIALRLLTVMHQDGNANFGNAIFSKASTILNIGETKLYELWAEWTKSEGKHIPQSFIKMPA